MDREQKTVNKALDQKGMTTGKLMKTYLRVISNRKMKPSKLKIISFK